MVNGVDLMSQHGWRSVAGNTSHYTSSARGVCGVDRLLLLGLAFPPINGSDIPE